jgi:hypothetical protein
MTPLFPMPGNAFGHCFSLKKSNFGLSIQIFDSKGIHLRHQRCEHTGLVPVATSSEPKSETLIGVIMTNKIIAALLVAASATLAAPAFASGYGPAPFYRPAVGAPASQQGQSVQTVAVERAAADANAYGGVNGASTQSGNRQATAPQASAQ